MVLGRKRPRFLERGRGNRGVSKRRGTESGRRLHSHARIREVFDPQSAGASAGATSRLGRAGAHVTARASDRSARALHSRGVSTLESRLSSNDTSVNEGDGGGIADSVSGGASVATSSPTRVTVGRRTSPTSSRPNNQGVDQSVGEDEQHELESTLERHRAALKCSCKCNCRELFGDDQLALLAAFRKVSKDSSQAVRHASVRSLVLNGYLSMNDEYTMRGGRPRAAPRKRAACEYRVLARPVCREFLLSVACASQKLLGTVRSELDSHEMKTLNWTARNVRCTPAADRARMFVYNYVLENAVQLPDGRRVYDGSDGKAALKGAFVLPHNSSKQAVYTEYVAYSHANGFDDVVGISSFRKMWKKKFRNVKFMTTKSDYCDTCIELEQQVRNEEPRALDRLNEHETRFKREREVYKESIEACRVSLNANGKGDARAHFANPAHATPPNTRDAVLHITVDFAQDFMLPHTAKQGQALYFTSRAKLAMCGIGIPALKRHVTYCLPEGTTPLTDSKRSCKTASHVCSILHDFFNRMSYGEKELIINMDNCTGQNKNWIVMAYLAYRVASGLHSKITVKFMIAGHTKFYCDQKFGSLKRELRRNDVYNVDDVLEAVARMKGQAAVDAADVEFFEWAVALKPIYRALRGISQYQIMEFRKETPNTVFLKSDSSADEWYEYRLVKESRGTVAAPLIDLNSVRMKSYEPTKERLEYVSDNVIPLVPEDKRQRLWPFGL